MENNDLAARNDVGDSKTVQKQIANYDLRVNPPPKPLLATESECSEKLFSSMMVMMI